MDFCLNENVFYSIVRSFSIYWLHVRPFSHFISFHSVKLLQCRNMHGNIETISMCFLLSAGIKCVSRPPFVYSVMQFWFFFMFGDEISISSLHSHYLMVKSILRLIRERIKKAKWTVLCNYELWTIPFYSLSISSRPLFKCFDRIFFYSFPKP